MKKTFLTTLLSVFALGAVAQDLALKQGGFGDNWYIQAQGGASYLFSEYSEKAKFGDLITPVAALSIGKNFAPQIGLRAQVAGWESKSRKSYDDSGTYKFKYIQTSIDALINLTNLGAYNGPKGFNLYAILGVTYVHGFKEKKIDLGIRDILAPRAGLQADFRLTSALSLNLEANASFLDDKFNGHVGGRQYDVPVNALLGLTYRFKGGFEAVAALDPAQIALLNGEINAQRDLIAARDQQLSALSNQLAKKLAEGPVVEQVEVIDSEVIMNAVVVFRLGSAVLEQNQDINIYNAAKYLQSNPGVNIVVTGYADKGTGTEKINQALSQRRAQAVADILTNKYGIAANRITVEASGDKVQPFEIDAWNRVVIFTAK